MAKKTPRKPARELPIPTVTYQTPISRPVKRAGARRLMVEICGGQISTSPIEKHSYPATIHQALCRPVAVWPL